MFGGEKEGVALEAIASVYRKPQAAAPVAA
jgi:hypothetical protein